MAKLLSKLVRRTIRPHVRFDPNEVLKRGNPRTIAIEVAKTRQAAALAKETGLFRVPGIHDHQLQAGIIRFERLRGFVPIAQPIAYGAMGSDLVKRTAVILALLHDRLTIPDEFREALPEPWACSDEPDVTLHGDFNTDNLLYSPETDEIAIIDWSVSALLGATGSMGSRYVDLAWFIKSLFLKPAAYLFSRRPAPCADLFVSRYAEVCGNPPDRVRLRSIGRQCLDVVVANLRRRRLGYWIHRRQLVALGRYFDRAV